MEWGASGGVGVISRVADDEEGDAGAIWRKEKGPDPLTLSSLGGQSGQVLRAQCLPEPLDRRIYQGRILPGTLRRASTSR